MFGNHLRQEAAYQKEEASAKGGKKDSVGGSDWWKRHLAYERGGWRCIHSKEHGSMAGRGEGVVAAAVRQ